MVLESDSVREAFLPSADYHPSDTLQNQSLRILGRISFICTPLVLYLIAEGRPGRNGACARRRMRFAGGYVDCGSRRGLLQRRRHLQGRKRKTRWSPSSNDGWQRTSADKRCRSRGEWTDLSCIGAATSILLATGQLAFIVASSRGNCSPSVTLSPWTDILARFWTTSGVNPESHQASTLSCMLRVLNLMRAVVCKVRKLNTVDKTVLYKCTDVSCTVLTPLNGLFPL